MPWKQEGLIEKRGMNKQIRVNREIRARRVRVVRPEGDHVGVIPIEEALTMAEEAELDLVEVSPLSDPPVCRLMDYGKFKYEQSKRAHEAKKKQTFIHLKEVKFRPKTEDHDFRFKVRHIRRFLEHGDKVKVTVFFRGREIVHADLGKRILDRVIEEILDLGTVEQESRFEGRTMTIIIAPKKD